MKTLNIILIIAAFSLALTSCKDNGPVSVNDKDARVVENSAPGTTANVDPEFSVPLNPAHVGATNPGHDIGECPTPPEGQEGWWGWHFVMPGNDFTALSVTFENAGTFTADPYPGDPPVFVADPHDQHAYIWTPTPDKLLGGSAESSGNNNQFVLSHVCPGEENGRTIDVSKTVNTTFIRTHDWSIDKSVETEEGHELDGDSKIWLFIDGSGNEKATWTVDVTYEGFEDSGWNVSGEITIENIGTTDKTIASIVDELAGTAIDIDCGEDFSLPHVLGVDEILTCTYSEDVDGEIEGDNVATVVVEDEEDPFEATEPIVWGDPAEENNASITVVDTSDLFGEVELGTVDAPNNAQFTYKKFFKWEEFGAENCGSFKYDNTAKIIGGDYKVVDSDDARLKVNVQCFIFESAWAKGDPSEAFCDNGFNNWGWTNPIEENSSHEMDLWAGAGQCDTSKGTLVGVVAINYFGGVFDYEFILDEPYHLQETHVFAGSEMFPKLRNGRDTVAPGQYYIEDPLSGDIWVIAHGVVGLPDPDFGPGL